MNRIALTFPALVLLFTAGFLLTGCSGERGGSTAPPSDNLARSLSVNVLDLAGTDGLPLIQPGKDKEIPPRPADPASLPITEAGRWWDIEYAGWTAEKVSLPPSEKTGARGRKIILLKAGDHPYWTAYLKGFRTVTDAYEMDVKVFNSNWNMDLQAQQTDQAINDRPDIIVMAPVDATACTPLMRKISRSGIPLIASNTIPTDEAMRYCHAWTGPDDWGQFRMLSRTLADHMDRTGGYAIIRHMPGSSPFFARTYAPISELAEYAPAMELLEMDTANLEADGTMQLVSAWLIKHGRNLKGLILAGDGFSMTGALEAVKASGREDITIVAAGNSKIGMDAVKSGEVAAITYQSAEGDGALAAWTAARFLNGQDVEPVVYLPRHIITRQDVEEFYPAQW